MKKALIIVAHPDDETIWMGGTILRNKYDWALIVICRKSDPDRYSKFKKVCDYYKIKNYKIEDVDDKEFYPLDIKELSNLIYGLIDNKEYDYVYTHGSFGEYGHIRHKETHNAVRLLLKEGRLKAKKLFCFSYKKKKDDIVNGEFDTYLSLTDSELKQKQHLMRDVYGYPEWTFDYRACLKKETFQSETI